MLPQEVRNLYDQLIGGELLPADFFCIVISLYDTEEAGRYVAAAIQQLSSSSQLLAAELQARYLELFGDLPGMRNDPIIISLRINFASSGVSEYFGSGAVDFDASTRILFCHRYLISVPICQRIRIGTRISQIRNAGGVSCVASPG
jgi:hypothetical protein